jgi:hypothetical protein
VAPDQPSNYSKFGADLADALEQVAGDSQLLGDPAAALEVLGMTLPPGVDITPHLDSEALMNAAAAIRAGGIPAFWPWVWFIPWVGLVRPPKGGPSE